MDVDEVFAQFEALGTEQARKIYQRRGIAQPLSGVSSADLGQLKKRIGRDQTLAEALWKTGHYEAQLLAVMVADPTAFHATELDSWAGTANSYGTIDPFARDIVVRTPFAVKTVPHWLEDERSLVRRAAWATVGCLALFDANLPDAYFLDFLPRIESGIHDAPNRVKESMNSALIAIGGRNDALRRPATESARRIGRVKVDHGETNCKTPDAESYIDRMFAHKAARAARPEPRPPRR